MKRNLTFQVTDRFHILVDTAAHKKGYWSRSEYCRQALKNQLMKDGFLDNAGDPLEGVIDPRGNSGQLTLGEGERGWL